MTWLREAGVDGAFIAACFALAALGAGRLVWRGRKLDVRLLVEQFAIGFGLLGMLTVAAGALGLFHWPLMLVLIFFLITVLIYLTKLRMVSATLVPRFVRHRSARRAGTGARTRCVELSSARGGRLGAHGKRSVQRA